MPHSPIDYFRAIHNATGLTNIRDAKIAEYQARFAADFDSSINVEHNVLRNDMKQDFIIVPTQTGCNLWARPGETFNVGDIIYFNTLHWLVTEVNFEDSLNRSGSMVRCNRQIKWQNKKTGEIISRWCLAEKPYTTNVTKGLSISNSNREYKIQLSCDDETMQVDLDRRFLLEEINGSPKAYKLLSVDTITNRHQDVEGGFLIWNVEQTEYNPLTDNAELMIADYFDTGSASDVEKDSDDKLICSIDGRQTIREGFSRLYTATFYDANGTETSDGITAIWEAHAPNGTITLEPDGHTAKLTLVEGAVTGDRIEITVKDEEGNYAPAVFYVEVIEFL